MIRLRSFAQPGLLVWLLPYIVLAAAAPFLHCCEHRSAATDARAQQQAAVSDADSADTRLEPARPVHRHDPAKCGVCSWSRASLGNCPVAQTASVTAPSVDSFTAEPIAADPVPCGLSRPRAPPAC